MGFLNSYAHDSGGGNDPSFSSVVMLSHFDNNMTNFGSGPAWVNGSPAPTLSATQSKFGGFSLNFGGATQTTTSTGSSYSLGTGDHTIEFWVYLASVTTGQNLLDFRSASNQASPVLYVVTGTVRYFSSNADRITSGASAIAVNTWTNICLCRISAVSTLYINGTQAGSTFADTENSTAGVLHMPTFSGATGIPSGFIDEIRVTKGVGRYSGNYTPAVAAFANF